MKVLAICRLRPGIEPAEICPHVKEEALMLEEWRDAGTVLEAYSPGGLGVVLVIDVSTSEEARTLVATLPLSAAGVIEAELIETPSLAVLATSTG